MHNQKFEGLSKVPFEEAKKNIRTGDLLFCNGRYLVSELIKKASGSMFSHIALLFYWDQHVFVLESVEDDGVRAIPLSNYLYNYENSNGKYKGDLYIARHDVIGDPCFDKDKIDKMFKRAIELLNRSYDKLEIAKIIARIGLGIGRHSDDDEYTCSEFVAECFKELGIYLKGDAEDFIFPEHIAADPEVKPLFQVIQ